MAPFGPPNACHPALDRDPGSRHDVDMKRLRVVSVVVMALVSAACSVPSGSAGGPTLPAPTSISAASASAASTGPTPTPTPTPTPEVAFRALDLPAAYSRSRAEAVDGTTAVGWVQIGIDDEQPAVWDTTTGALRVLVVPKEFIHPNGDTFVRLVGVSGTTAVGTGVLGTPGTRGQERAMAWNTETGDLRILDIPADFAKAEAHAISSSTAVGQVWTLHGEDGRPVAWDTETGAVRILEVPAGYACSDPLAVSGDTIVGIRCDQDDALPLVWDQRAATALDLDLLPPTHDGVPRAVDGTTAVGNCCFGEEGTPLPLIWDTSTGSVRQLTLPTPFVNGGAEGVSGTVVIGSAEFTSLIWDLATGQARVLPAPEGYEYANLVAVSGRTIVGSACEPPPSTSENGRCAAAAWILP
jgi:hypothetical protein